MKLAKLVGKNQFFIETFLITLSVASFALHHQQAILIVFLTLAVFYFLSAYLPLQIPEDRKVMLIEIFAPKVLSISSSICVIGILFFTMHFSGYQEMLMIGGLSISITAVLLLICWLKTQQIGFLFNLVRAVALGGLSWYIFLNYPSPSVP